MSLRNIEVKSSYDSDEDDVLSEFFVPCISQANEYLRLAGFFSSTTLAVAARGLSKFIERGGSMKMIVGANLQQEDIEVIDEAYRDPEKIISEKFVDDLENMTSKFQEDHVEALGWMIANGYLDIKVALLRQNGELVPANQAQGIFHPKVGILEDEEGNRLSFSGSENATASGWKNNVEEFKVFREWERGEKKFFQDDLNKFKKYWNNEGIRTEVIDVPQAIEDKLVDIAPSDKEDLNIDSWDKGQSEEPTSTVSLWPPQNEAVLAWEENGRQGVFEMATGTGKTYTALECVNRVFEDQESCLTVIACPQNHLIDQWKEEIEEFGLAPQTVVASSSNRNWKDDLHDAIHDLRFGITDQLVVLTTHDTFSSDHFREAVSVVDEDNTFLIVDEVHGAGAPTQREGLLELYQYRLGLSATPARWMDEEGTKEIFSYFGEEDLNEPTYQFTLKDAITSINPSTGDTYLCRYEYRPQFVSLTPEELQEYREKTKKIVRAYHAASTQREKEKALAQMGSQRQDVVRNAANKYDALEKLLEELGSDISHTLFYVSPQQMDTVQNELMRQNIVQCKFTQEEKTTPSSQYNGLSERQHILRKFAKGRYQALVAIKCLDEGVNVRSTERAVIMASTGNPRQYIQRRGRVLRHAPEKEKAIIHDILVIPSLGTDVSDDFAEMERKIVKKELKRYKEFADAATNTMECYDSIEKIEDKYNIAV